MRTISGFLLILAMSTCTAYYDSYNVSETCSQVSSALNTYLWSIDDMPQMYRVGMATYLMTGINIVRPESLDPVMCPLIDSTSLSEIQTQLVETGLVGKVAALAYRMGVIGYAQHMEHMQYINPEYMDEDYRELYSNIAQITTHLKAYGYMDFDTISLAVTYGCSVGIGMNNPLTNPPIFPGSFTTDDEQMGEMLSVDILTIIRSLKQIWGYRWPMYNQAVVQYTAGVVDLSNATSMRNLMNGIAACRSEADVATFVESNFLGPLLNLYFPQVDRILTAHRRRMESKMIYISTSEYYTDEEREQFREMSQAFYAMHDALRTSGLFSLS